MGGNFFLKFEEGEQQMRGESILCGSSVGELVKVGEFFFNQLQK